MTLKEYAQIIKKSFILPNPPSCCRPNDRTALYRLRGMYDAILLDTPLVLLVADVILLHRPADGVLQVVKYGHTTRKMLRESRRVFETAGIRPAALF